MVATSASMPTSPRSVFTRTRPSRRAKVEWCVRHADWHDRMVLLKGQGVPLNRRYWHEVLGFNYRMVNLSAALGIAQLARLDSILAKKRRLADRYRLGLQSLPITLQPEMAGSQSAWWLIAATLATPAARDGLSTYLESRGIETRLVFLPLQRFPMYRSEAPSTPNADHISACGLCLPSWPDIHDDQVDRIVRGNEALLRSLMAR